MKYNKRPENARSAEPQLETVRFEFNHPTPTTVSVSGSFNDRGVEARHIPSARGGVRLNLLALATASLVTLLVLAAPFLCFGASRNESSEHQPPGRVANHEVVSATIHLPKKATPLSRRAAGILASRIEEYSGARATTSGKGDLHVYLAISPGIGQEGFRISGRSNGGINITGNDERGLLYGVGKFLHTSTFSKQGFTPSPWRGTSVPSKPVRGMYFATHFRNYYEEAPIEEVTRYVEDMSLWGVNSFLVWFGIEAYNGINDPNGQAMLVRLRALLKAGKDLGLNTSLGCVANEGYKNSPLALRAESSTSQNGYRPDYMPNLPNLGTELCASKPGVSELELSYCQEKFAAFSSVGLDYWFFAAYDNGGCTCPKCAPWGINAYLRLAELEARAFRRAFPKGKVILSTWYFDRFIDGEWAGITDKFNAHKPDWVDYIMAGDFGDKFPQYPLVHGTPGGLPMLNFPEISMYQCVPWGGFGANPLPKYVQSLWDVAKSKLAGGFPYSEGLYEDVNKVMVFQLYWDADKSTEQTMREYIAFYFSPAVVENVSRAMNILERNLPRSRAEKDGITMIYLNNTAGAEEAYRLMTEADAQLPDRVRSSWRWRVVYLRAQIDSELVRHKFRVSQKCATAFKELTKIYHAENTGDFLAPPRNITGIVTAESNLTHDLKNN